MILLGITESAFYEEISPAMVERLAFLQELEAARSKWGPKG